MHDRVVADPKRSFKSYPFGQFPDFDEPGFQFILLNAGKRTARYQSVRQNSLLLLFRPGRFADIPKIYRGVIFVFRTIDRIDHRILFQTGDEFLDMLFAAVLESKVCTQGKLASGRYNSAKTPFKLSASLSFCSKTRASARGDSTQ